ncbi:MAG: HAD family phosphatase [Bacteroidales bacterium]|nr:HAD family phosphatase [Bacteroidales bacterium]
MNERLHLHSGPRPIGTVIFDFGGVLLNLNPDKCRAAFHALGIHQIEEFIDRYRPKGLFYEAECGNIGQETFIQALQKLADRPVSREEVIAAYTSFLIELPLYKLQLLRQLRKRFQVYLLSNINELCFNFCKEKFFRQEGRRFEDYFDRCYLSYQMRICKPDPGIYERMLADSGIDPATALFIDDSRANTDIADSFGINTYLALPEEDFRPLFQLPVLQQ